MPYDWENDFETGDTSTWHGVVETSGNDAFSVQSSEVAFGDYAGEAFTLGVGSEAYVYYIWGSGYSTIGFRAEINFQTLPPDTKSLGFMEIRDGNADLIVNLRVENIGGAFFITVYNAVENDTYFTEAPLGFGTNAWYTFKLTVSRHDTVGIISVNLDGTEIIQKLLIDTKTSFLYNEIRLGITGIPYNTLTSARVYVDRVVVDGEFIGQPTTTTTSTSTTSTSTTSTTISSSTSTTSTSSSTSTTSTSSTIQPNLTSSTTSTSTSTTSTSTTTPPDLWCDGFETGDFTEWDVVSGNIIVTSGLSHSGTYSAESVQYNGHLRKSVFYGDETWTRFYVYVNILSEASNSILPLCEFTGANQAFIGQVGIKKGGVGTWDWWLKTKDGGTTREQQGGTVLENTWYCIRVQHIIAPLGSGNGTFKAYFGLGPDTTLGGITYDNRARGQIYQIKYGHLADTYFNPDTRIFIDDVCIDIEDPTCDPTTTSTSTTSTTLSSSTTSTSTSTTSTSTTVTSPPIIGYVPYGDPDGWTWTSPSVGLSDVPEGAPGGWVWDILGDGDIVMTGGPSSWVWVTFEKTTSTTTSTTAPPI